jgi:serine/threonine protein kinase
MSVIKKSSTVEVIREGDQIIKKIKWFDDISKKVVYNELDAVQNIQSRYIPKFLGYNISVNEYYITIYMNYIEGRTLDNIEKIKLSNILPQLIYGLKDIFDQGYIHGDIKPENIIIGNDEQVYYIDFGFACKIDPIDESGKYYRGSLPYLYPPILLGKIKSKEFTSDILKRNDMYALANVIHWIFTKTTIVRIHVDDNRTKYLKRIENNEKEIKTGYPEFDMLIHLMISTSIDFEIIIDMINYCCKKYNI